MRIMERIKRMAISPVNGTLALLADAVKPATALEPVTNPATQAAGFSNTTLNTFALSVLAQTLESQEQLLQSSGNGSSQQAGADNIVQAGESGVAAVAAKYSTTQALAAPAIAPTVNIQS